MRVLPILLICLLAGCAAALQEPPALAELAGDAPQFPPAEVDRLIAEAERLYAERSLSSVSEAGRVWLSAARADPDRVEGLLGATRARIWCATHAELDDERLDHAVSAVQLAQWCRRKKPDDPECSYWLALAMGVQAQERKTTAFDALPQIAELLEQVAARRPEIDHGGAERTLALLYLRAPGWPSGPGDADRGLEYARGAVGIDPEYPPNQLALAEALRATEDNAGGREAYRRALALARDRISRGDPDAAEWVEQAERALGRRRSN